MAQKTYKCKECGREFKVEYLFFKPKQINCPKCGSEKIEKKQTSDGCGSNNTNWFT